MRVTIFILTQSFGLFIREDLYGFKMIWGWALDLNWSIYAECVYLLDEIINIWSV